MQYLYYVKGVATFDLGPSLVVRGRTVNDIVKTHFPKSIELGLYAFIFAIVVGVPLGVIAAKHNTMVDYSAMFFSNVFHAIPSFLVATLLIYFVALEVGRYRRAAGRPGSTSSCPRSRSASPRWRSSPGSCGGRCWRRCSRTTSAPRGRRAPLPARRRAARARNSLIPVITGRRAAARLHHHRLLRDRADLQHPRASASTTSLPSTPATTRS